MDSKEKSKQYECCPITDTCYRMKTLKQNEEHKDRNLKHNNTGLIQELGEQANMNQTMIM